MKVEIVMDLRRGKPAKVREVRKNGRRVRPLRAFYPDSGRVWQLINRREVLVGIEECHP